jgi:hypothetical protein
MFKFFHNYQRAFLFFTAGIIIFSFLFFGVFTPYRPGFEQEEDETTQLTRWVTYDDGALCRSLFETGIAEHIAAAFWSDIQPEIQERLTKAKHFNLYVHPDSSAVSFASLWERAFPDFKKEWDSLQKEQTASPETFSTLARLYRKQLMAPAEQSRQVLLYLQRQKNLTQDPTLANRDISLCGFHTVADWFGPAFAKHCAEFILAAAENGEKAGYSVSRDELRNANSRNPQILKKVILCRRYLQGTGAALFVDPLLHQQFATYAHEAVEVERYQWPTALQLKTRDDLLVFQTYLSFVSKEDLHKNPLLLPTSFRTAEELVTSAPELVQTPYRAHVAELSLQNIRDSIPLRSLLQWQVEDDHWAFLCKEFSGLNAKKKRSERSATLNGLAADLRKKIDEETRRQMIRDNPQWISDALAQLSLKERDLLLSAGYTPLENVERHKDFSTLVAKASQGDLAAATALQRYSDDGETIYRIEGVEQIRTPRILTFAEAKERGSLKKRLPTDSATYLRPLFIAIDRVASKQEWTPGEGPAAFYATNRFLPAAQSAREALRVNRDDPVWLKQSDLLTDQFKIERIYTEVSRKENEKLCAQETGSWSSIESLPNSGLQFCYVAGRVQPPAPTRANLEQALLSAELQCCLADQIIQAMKE